MELTDTDENERPMLFSGWSVRRTKDEAKTQTRRIVNPQPDYVVDGTPFNQKVVEKVEDGELVERTHNDEGHPYVDEITCPYGEPGDILWVRESFRFPAVNDAISPSEYVGAGCDVWRYEADETIHDSGGWTENHDFEWGRLRPSIFMPYDLCRLRLRVEDVRVEQVQEIGQEDAKAEGFERTKRAEAEDVFTGRDMVFYDAPTLHFQKKWNDIHGDGAWDENPHVWVILFSLLTDSPATP